jgi:hypothetical protein
MTETQSIEFKPIFYHDLILKLGNCNRRYSNRCYNMARPIEKTPIIKGEDAKRFKKIF